MNSSVDSLLGSFYSGVTLGAGLPLSLSKLVAKIEGGEFIDMGNCCQIGWEPQDLKILGEFCSSVALRKGSWNG